MKLTLLPALCALALVATGTPSFAQSPEQARTAHQDTKFLEAANQGSVDEIEIAKLVLSKSTDDEVKSFAQKMIDDHGKLLEDMKPFDMEAGVTVPEHADASTAAMKLKLDVLSGKALDKAYIKGMVEDHHKDLQDFLKEESSTGYPAFKTAVGKGAKVVREHLELIDQLAKKNGVAPAPVPSSGM